jgi:hypothetical protein
MMSASFKVLLAPLKGSLILFGAIWLGLGLLAYTVAHRYDATLAELQTAKLALHTAQAQQADQQQQLAWLTQYQPAYEHWQAVGLLGEPQRLSWIHHLQTIQRQQHLPDVQYTVSEQSAYAPAFVALGQFGMLKSSMHLDMATQGGWPEGATPMLQLLSAMRQLHPATMQVQHCDFKFLAEKTTHSVCDLDWLSLG